MKRVFLLGVIMSIGIAQAYAASHREPKAKVILSKDSDVYVWKSTIEPSKEGDGLPLHRHDYARILIPLTEGTLERQDKDGKITQYIFKVGDPVALPADTPQGLHTDENKGALPIELIVVQFNQAGPVDMEGLTAYELAKKISN